MFDNSTLLQPGAQPGDIIAGTLGLNATSVSVGAPAPASGSGTSTPAAENSTSPLASPSPSLSPSPSPQSSAASPTIATRTLEVWVDSSALSNEALQSLLVGAANLSLARLPVVLRQPCE